ncbi:MULTISPECIES: hypothetical protein [Prevotellaceae]|uniref:HlyD family secretion protein n=1 Tax=Prevotella intermedia TaxID=28131 RepID=A0A2G8I846_PREIN|nr:MULTISPECIES: hypothetical protein [Prevotellaceae]MCG2651658.1 hypothetical protein [Alloprevotella tannerae]PIK19597.1 hypothetical protein CTI18_11930 [Prevotella intermedia]
MEEEKKQERSFELRSEKVRSIVEQIPSSLVRYGITTIGTVLLCLFAVAYFLPYKQVYYGTATVREINNTPTDSIEIAILLRFENKHLENINGQIIYLQSPYGTFAGQLRDLFIVRDTLERQEALCRFKSAEIKSVENQTVDFQIVHSSGNLLQKMLGEL